MTAPAATAQFVVGVDIGGTSIKGIVAGRDGVPRARLDRSTPVGDGVDAVVDAIVQVASRLSGEAGEKAEPAGVGLVMPGLVDRAEGIARWSANIGWRDVPIRKLIAARLGQRVTIAHDVRAAAMAEVACGAARGTREALFVAIGTGIAGALITGGAVIHGAAGIAGESGHVPVLPGGGLDLLARAQVAHDLCGLVKLVADSATGKLLGAPCGVRRGRRGDPGRDARGEVRVSPSTT